MQSAFTEFKDPDELKGGGGKHFTCLISQDEGRSPHFYLKNNNNYLL